MNNNYCKYLFQVLFPYNLSIVHNQFTLNLIITITIKTPLQRYAI